MKGSVCLVPAANRGFFGYSADTPTLQLGSRRWAQWQPSAAPHTGQLATFRQNQRKVEATHFYTVARHQLDTLLGKDTHTAHKTLHLVSSAALAHMQRAH
jgi:hypothetical protein